MISDTWFRLVSFSTKSISNIESRLHRQDLRYHQSTQSWKYLDNKFPCVESKIYGKWVNTEMFVINILYDLYILFIIHKFLQPFGEGLVTIVVPQLRRGENSLLLWNTSNLTAPIYTFVGHTDAVLEFQWRHQKLGIGCRIMLRNFL